MKKSNAFVLEIFFIRSLACISVVLIHALTTTLAHFYQQPDETREFLQSVQLLLMYGTPIFVFISEFVISYNYRERVPKGFLSKRFRFIFIPYMVMGIFYAFYTQYETGMSAIWEKAWKNILLGEYHGYFILIIFQFYLIHLIFQRIQHLFKPSIVLVVSFVVNAAYLAFFNFVDPPDIPMGHYIWHRLSWLPFLGWIFYFFFGYYAGRKFEGFKQWVLRKKGSVVLLWGCSGLLVLSLTRAQVLVETSSKRVDVFLFTNAMILFLFLVAFHLTKIPAWLIVISQYSFGIYLLHPFFQSITAKMMRLGQIPILSDNPYILALFFLLLGLLLPIVTVYLLNRIPFGFYVAGKVGVRPAKRKQNENP